MSSLLMWFVLVAVALLFGEFLARRHQTGTRLWGDFTQALAGLTYFVMVVLVMFAFGGVIAFVLALLGGLYWALFRTKTNDVRDSIHGRTG